VHSLFLYPMGDETDVDDQDLATCDFKKEHFGMNLYQMIALLWKQSWKNSKRDRKNHIITFSCVLVILLRYVFSHSEAFTSHQYT